LELAERVGNSIAKRLDLRKILEAALYEAEDSPTKRMHGRQLTMEYIAAEGFRCPILVDNREGLDFQAPNTKSM